MPHSDPSTKNPDCTLVVFRCPTTLAEALAAKAAQCHTSVSAIIRQLLKAGLLKQSV
jgi:hypothetical protein